MYKNSTFRTGLTRAAVLAALALILLWMPQDHSVHAQAGCVVAPSPATTYVVPGGQVAIDLQISNVIDLYGADLRLSFDRTKVNVVDANPLTKNTVEIMPGPIADPPEGAFVLFNVADNTAGTVKFVFTRTNPAPAFNGTGILATITFKAMATGSTLVHFNSVSLSTRNGVSIPCSMQDGMIQVQAVTASTVTGLEAAASSDARGALFGFAAFALAGGLLLRRGRRTRD